LMLIMCICSTDDAAQDTAMELMSMALI